MTKPEEEMDEPTTAIKLAIVAQEIAQYTNTIFLLKMRHRVNKDLGNPPDVLKPLEDELVQAMLRVSKYKQIKAELEKELKTEEPKP